MKKISELFHFTPGERIGIIILIGLLLVVIVTISYHDDPHIIITTTPPASQKSYSRSKPHQHQPTPRHQTRSSATPKTFVFDPNKLPVDSFVLLGLSRKQALAIDKYRKTGAVFHDAHDFAKMYVVSPEFFERVKPFITIASPQDYSVKHYSKNSTPTKYVKRTISKFELNTATFEQLIELPYIGEKRARAIIDYREKAGGICEIQQLLHFKYIDQKTIDTLSYYLYIDQSRIIKHNINTITLEELKPHPDFKYYTSKKIIDYRTIVGKINNINELLDNKILDSTTFVRVQRYLTTQ